MNNQLAELFKSLQKEGYSGALIKEIIEALSYGIDVTPYMTPDYDFYQIQELATTIRTGVDLKYATQPTKYNVYQMIVLRHGLELGLDTSKYDNPELKSTEMYVIMQALQLGLPVDDNVDLGKLEYDVRESGKEKAETIRFLKKEIEKGKGGITIEEYVNNYIYKENSKKYGYRTPNRYIR